MSKARHVVSIAVTAMIVAGLGVTGEAQGTVGVPQQLAAIRQQIAAMQSSLGTLPDQAAALTEIQETLASVTSSLAALEQSLANVDPTVSRAVTLGTGNAYGALGTFISCGAQNVGTTTVNATVTQLDISGVVVLQLPMSFAPGNGNSFSVAGPGGLGADKHRWCKFEYEGQPNALRAWMSVVDGATGIERAVHEAR